LQYDIPWLVRSRLLRVNEKQPVDHVERRLRSKSVELSDVVSSGDTFFYDYDFGDAWRPEIEVASPSSSEESRPWPVCSGGERAGPPE
jgi:hypothetical protein